MGPSKGKGKGKGKGKEEVKEEEEPERKAAPRKVLPKSLKVLADIYKTMFKQPTPNLSEHARILKEFEDEAATRALEHYKALSQEDRQYFNIAKAATFLETMTRLITQSENSPTATNTGGGYHLANIPEVPHQEPPPGWTPEPKKTIEEIGEGF